MRVGTEGGGGRRGGGWLVAAGAWRRCPSPPSPASDDIVRGYVHVHLHQRGRGRSDAVRRWRRGWGTCLSQLRRVSRRAPAWRVVAPVTRGREGGGGVVGEAGQWVFLWCPLRRVPHPPMRLPSHSTTLPPPSHALTHPLSARPPTHLIIRPSTSHPPAHLFMFPAHLTVQPLTSSSTRPPLHLLIGAPFCTRCASSLFSTHLPPHSSLCPFTGPRATLGVSFLACPSSTTGRAPACGNHAGCSVAPGVGSSCCPWSVGRGRGVGG